jgi:hypothetical protein
MSESDTPRTDAIVFPPVDDSSAQIPNWHRIVSYEHAKELERELTAARAEIARWNSSFDGHVYVKNEEYAELCENKRQRDRLAEALKEYREALSDGPENCSYKMYEAVDEFAEQALQSLTTNTTESRREFEEWVTRELNYTLARYDSGLYLAPSVNLVWKAWRAVSEQLEFKVAELQTQIKEAVEIKNMATETLSVIKQKYGLGKRNVMKELQHKVAELEKILKDCLYEMPCSYVPNHTVEKLPVMIASQAQLLAEEITYSEKLVKQRDLLIEVLEVALNATVLNHRRDRWHSDAEYALHKIKLNK